MRKTLTTALIAAGIGVLAFAGVASAGGNSGASSGPIGGINLDASSAAHWQICGQNAFALPTGQTCDNRDHIGSGPQSGAHSTGVALANIDASDAAHWQICGQNLFSLVPNQTCDNTDHIG